MKIRIEAEGYRFTIPLPIMVALNHVTLRILSGHIEKYSTIPINEESLKALRKELIHAKRTFGRLVLVDVSSSDGTKVVITL